MAPSKRKASQVEPLGASAAKKARSKKDVENTASSTRLSRTSLITASKPRSTQSSIPRASVETASSTHTKSALRGMSKRKTGGRTKVKRNASAPKADHVLSQVNGRRQTSVSVNLPKNKTASDVADWQNDEDYDGPSYWLMKAEPESRIEKGKDVKFSIDDLRVASEPEPWDGEFEFSNVFQWALTCCEKVSETS